MNPSMLFRYSDGRLDFETVDADKKIDVNFWTINQKTQGVVRLDAFELRKLIDFLTIQLSKMESSPTIPQKKK